MLRIALFTASVALLAACSSNSVTGVDTSGGGGNPSGGTPSDGTGGDPASGGAGGSLPSGGRGGGGTVGLCGSGGAIFIPSVHCFCPEPSCGDVCMGIFPELWSSCRGTQQRIVGDPCTQDLDCWHANPKDIVNEGTAGSAGSGNVERLGCTGSCDSSNCFSAFKCQVQAEPIEPTVTCNGADFIHPDQPYLITRNGCTEGACLDAPDRASVCVGECVTTEDCPDDSLCQEVPSLDKDGVSSAFRVCVPN